MAGEKIPVLIAEKAQGLALQLIPTITQIAEQTGIQNIGQPNMVMPTTCLSQNELQKILTLRNNMVDKLNAISKTIELLSKPITTLNTIANTTSTVLNTTDKARIAANIALAFVPLTPVS